MCIISVHPNGATGVLIGSGGCFISGRCCHASAARAASVPRQDHSSCSSTPSAKSGRHSYVIHITTADRTAVFVCTVRPIRPPRPIICITPKAPLFYMNVSTVSCQHFQHSATTYGVPVYRGGGTLHRPTYCTGFVLPCSSPVGETRMPALSTDVEQTSSRGAAIHPAVRATSWTHHIAKAHGVRHTQQAIVEL